MLFALPYTTGHRGIPMFLDFENNFKMRHRKFLLPVILLVWTLSACNSATEEEAKSALYLHRI